MVSSAQFDDVVMKTGTLAGPLQHLKPINGHRMFGRQRANKHGNTLPNHNLPERLYIACIGVVRFNGTTLRKWVKCKTAMGHCFNTIQEQLGRPHVLENGYAIISKIVDIVVTVQGGLSDQVKETVKAVTSCSSNVIYLSIRVCPAAR